MKPLLVFYIAFTMPAILFIATILYADVSNAQLKQTLAESGVYQQLSTQLTQADAEIDDPFQDVVRDRFTPKYLRSKTELALDDSTNWITGKSKNVPVVSLKELKDDLNSRDSELLTSLQNVPDEAKLAEAGIEPEQREAYLRQVTQISDFARSDFSVKLDQHLQGFKTVYQGLQIALPLMGIILLACVFMVMKLAEGLPAKLKWLGITFLVIAIVGFGIILTNMFILKSVAQVSLLNDSEFITVITPIILAILNHFMQLYEAYQRIVVYVCIGGAAACFLMMVLTKNQEIKAVKPLKIKRSYWEKP